jgi:hypothetical protein
VASTIAREAVCTCRGPEPILRLGTAGLSSGGGFD